MATKSKSTRSKPLLTTVHLLNTSDSEPTTSMESSVDLFIVFDDNSNRVSASPAASRLIDVSEEPPREKAQSYREVLFESPLDGVFIIDAETMRIVLANQTTAEMFGFDSAEDMAGVNALKFVHPEDKDRVLRSISQDVIQNNQRLVYKFRATTRDGKEIRVRAVASRIEHQGRPAGLISIKAIGEGLREKEQTEFTSRLPSVVELAAGIAHEMSDPLAAILAYDQLLMTKDNLENTMKSGLEAIYREAQRATTITDNLLSFAHRRKPEKSLISINKVIESVLELCARHLEVNNIEVSVELSPDLPETMADFHQMQQTFVNIVNNAERAMAEAHGHGKLRVITQEAGEMIRIAFIDDGPGIQDDDLTKIFDPFFTGKGPTKGTGLGLAVCQGLVEAHGGHIYARSKFGEGTSFEVEIPIISAEQPVAEQPEPIHAECE